MSDMSTNLQGKSLPADVVIKLNMLRAELEEGDITRKGYEKKKSQLLAPYTNAPSPTTNYAQRGSPGNYPPRGSPNNSKKGLPPGIRAEAIQLAIAKRNNDESVALPAPTKRQSFVTKRSQSDSKSPRPHSSFIPQTSYADTPVGSVEDISSPQTRSPKSANRSRSTVQNPFDEIGPLPPQFQKSPLYDSNQRYSEQAPPPDVTQGDVGMSQAGRRSAQMSSMRLKSDESIDSGGRVSAKIQQLLNTLKRPKRKPLKEFFVDENDHIEVTKPDPNAPHPEGAISKPAMGEQLSIPEGLPKSFTEAIRRYGSSSYKLPVMSVVDQNGKLIYTLCYNKLLSRSHKIAYCLLHKVGSHREGTSIIQGDRVALMYSADDPIGFISAFYGCLIAGVVPVPVDPPATKDDAGSHQIGFLLGSCGLSWALTSESCFKTLPRDDVGHPFQCRGWPRLQWYITDGLSRPPRDWHPPQLSKEAAVSAYIEYTLDKDGSALGVTIARETMLAHCQAISQACKYTEGEIMISSLDFKRGMGLSHSMCASVLNGMHVVFVPPAVQIQNPCAWLLQIMKQKASYCLVSSHDLHLCLHSGRDFRDISLSSLRMMLLGDRSNPWTLSACDSFVNTFEGHGLRPDVVCPCAYSPEAMTVSIRRPGSGSSTSSGRGVLSLNALSHGVVRVDKEDSLTALTLQDCGMVLPGAIVAVLKLDESPNLCQVDEVGELCIASHSTGNGYWGLAGKSSSTFQVHPIKEDGFPLSETYVRTGMLGFLGPGGLAFVCGSLDGIMTVQGRRHNAEDIKATVLAVDPIKFVHRGRIAVFSINVLREERIIIVSEQKSTASEEESFQWMSHVLPAVDSVHAVGIYCLCLVMPGGLPKRSNGVVDVSESKQKFLDGLLHPVNVLMCPHSTVTNLPKPRQKHSEPGPAASFVGNLVKGNRIAESEGRELAGVEDSGDMARKYQFLAEILKWRSQTTPEHNLFTLLNSKNHIVGTLSCLQLHKKAERFAYLAIEQIKLSPGDHVVLLYPPGLDLICAVYGCLYVGLVPVPVRPPNPHNVTTTLPTVKMIVHVSKSVAIFSSQSLIKLLKSKEAQTVVDIRSWPHMVSTDELPKRKLSISLNTVKPESIAYLDFSVSTTGMLAGVKMPHTALASLCRAQKIACELYPSRDVAVCLDPYCGLGFVLWCLSSVYAGHHTILIPPIELESVPSVWLQAVSHFRVRDTFCSYPVMELCTKHLPPHITMLKNRNVNLSNLRTCIAVAEERPRISLTQTFCAMFSSLGLSPKAVSTSFGCRVNISICMQEASHPEASSAYIDTRSLRHDRIFQVERGSPNSFCLMESGRILPGVKVVIANPETHGLCGDGSLGEIWVHSAHNGSGYFNVNEDDRLTEEHFHASLTTGDSRLTYARTGYLGFIKRTELTQTDGAPHDALFVVGALDEALMLRGLRYHPIDIETSVVRCHKGICESAVFTWTNLLVVVVELDADEREALDVVPLVTNIVLEDHQLIVGVVVVVDATVIPLNSRGEKQRMHLRDSFLADQLDPIYVAYNM